MIMEKAKGKKNLPGPIHLKAMGIFLQAIPDWDLFSN